MELVSSHLVTCKKAVILMEPESWKGLSVNHVVIALGVEKASVKSRPDSQRRTVSTSKWRVSQITLHIQCISNEKRAVVQIGTQLTHILPPPLPPVEGRMVTDSASWTNRYFMVPRKSSPEAEEAGVGPGFGLVSGRVGVPVRDGSLPEVKDCMTEDGQRSCRFKMYTSLYNPSAPINYPICHYPAIPDPLSPVRGLH